MNCCPIALQVLRTGVCRIKVHSQSSFVIAVVQPIIVSYNPTLTLRIYPIALYPLLSY